MHGLQQTMKTIIEQVMKGTPKYERIDTSGMLFVPGSVLASPLGCPKPIVVYVSPLNVGAAAVAKEVTDAVPSITLTEKRPQCMVGLPDVPDSLLGQLGEPSVSHQSPDRFAHFHHHHEGTKALSQPTHVLLYLNSATFIGDHAKALAQQVAAVLNFNQRTTDKKQLRLPVLMLHEADDPARCGCEFAEVMRSTPQHLLDLDMYKQLALGISEDAKLRQVGIALAAMELGAVHMHPKHTRNAYTVSARHLLSEVGGSVAPMVTVTPAAPTPRHPRRPRRTHATQAAHATHAAHATPRHTTQHTPPTPPTPPNSSLSV